MVATVLGGVYLVGLGAIGWSTIMSHVVLAYGQDDPRPGWLIATQVILWPAVLSWDALRALWRWTSGEPDAR